MGEILSGVYKIYCKSTSKYYIGQSVNVKNRLNQHLNELRNNKHINKELQEDFNNYGEDSFIFEKIKDVEEEYLNIFEKYYMEYYNSLEEGYNVIAINNLIKDKHKNKNSIKALRDIEFIEVPLVSGDIYAYQMFLRLEFMEDEIDNEKTMLSNDIKSTVHSIRDFLENRHIGFWKKSTEIAELELRRRFNKVGITDIELLDIENEFEFLRTKIMKVNVWVDKEFIEVNIKCTK